METTAVDPASLRKGDAVRFGTSKNVYIVQWYEEKKPGRMYLICHGPLGSQTAQGGQAFYVGPDRFRRVDPFSGKRELVDPVAVRKVDVRK